MLEKNPANHVPLSPLSFLSRASDVYPGHPALTNGGRTLTWRQLHDRAARLAHALRKRGIGKDDTVSYLAFNTPELFEAHFAVPMAGAVLNAINVRLDPETVAHILSFGECRVLVCDTQLSPTARRALEIMGDAAKGILVVDIVDEQVEGKGGRLGALTHEELLEEGDPGAGWSLPEDEWQSLALNFTSGTSGRPRGVLYHHRGSYLMTTGTVVGWQLPLHPKYLYTVPMFHCNGWGHAWTMAALAGHTVCCRQVSAKAVFDAIVDHRITHFGAAPVVLGMLVNAPDEDKREITHKVRAMTAGAPPPPAVIEKTQAMGIDVMQVYGLTETYGHVVHCAWQDKWDALPFDGQADRKAMQGVRFPSTEGLRVADTATGEDVPADGATMGEILIRANTVMKGYLKDPEATAAAFSGGWFHSGDLAVMHPDGYVQVKDRLKDIIISGGENVSSVEVEKALYRHPAVADAAIVAMRDEKWGEVPCAFVELKKGADASEDEIVAFCRERLAGFKCPKKVVFGALPKTATGKIKKYELRKSLG